MKSVRRIWRMVLFTLVLGVFAESPVSAQFKAKALHSAPARLADFTPHILTSGTPVTFTIGPVKQNTLFSGDFSSMITVPAGATRLEIKLETQPSGADVDLYARFGADVTLNNGSVVADHGSEGSTGSESIVITSTSSPALKAGDYYIALGLFTFDTTATVTLTATVTGGAAVPVVPANGVVNAADGTAAVAPGTILSLYGSNLATGTLKGPLPMVTGLLGSSVEVLSGGQTLVAPLFFVSPGQINAQLPYEAKTGAAQVRVRTAAGVSAWVDLTVQATAPRVLTMNMRGNGAAIMQHAADYRLVGDEAPAQSGEVLILYLIGLGATQPVARTGQAAGDGASLGPLNSSLNVTVTMGGVNAPVLWAGLTPALVGLYQINLRVPAGPPQGDIAIVVGCSGVNSQTSVTSRFSTGGTLVIGTGGGAVTSGGTTVTVPAGTFDQAVTLKVSTIANLPAPTDGRVTDVARVEGLPAIVRQPIRLALNITGTPPAGKALVFVRFDEEEGRGPMVLPAEIVNGQMIATLAAMPAGITTQSAPARAAVVDSNPLNAALWGVAGVGEERSPGGKATVHYHVGDIKDFDLAVEAGKLVDEAFGKLASAGVDTARRKTPVDVYLFSFSGTLGRIFQSDTNAEGETETELWGKAAVGLSLNLDVMRGKGSDAVRTTVGHELFHIVQSLYDPRPLWRRNYIKSPWLWMMEAASTWFEKKMARTSPYLSSNALANADFLFNHGLEFTPGDKTEVSRHGYGASMFLEYMTQYKGDAFPGTLFLEMEPSSGVVFQTPKYSPVEGLYNNEILLSFKWTDFVQKYAKGEVHPSLSMNNLLTSARTETYTFASDSDTGRQFQWDSPDLSAHLYKVEFKKWTSQWPAGTKVTFQMTGPRDAEMTVWKAQTGSGWTMLAKTTSSYEIPSAEAQAASGALYAVLIANGTMNRPFDKTTPITFEIKGPPVVSVFPAGVPLFAISLETRTAIEVKTTTTTPGYPTRVVTQPQYFWWQADNGARCRNCTVGMLGPLQWTGNTFRAVRDEKEVNGNCTFSWKTTITGQLAADGTGIATLTAKWDATARCDGNRDESYEFVLQNAKWPVAQGQVIPGGFTLVGPLTGIVSGVKYYQHYWDLNMDQVSESTQVNYGASDWHLEILFDKPY